MPTTFEYLKYAEAALAAYAVDLALGSNINLAAYERADMAPSQARQFDASWEVLGQQDIWDGFSAVLFQPVDSSGHAIGQKVLAIRGSESSNWGIDYLADAVNILLLGTNRGMRQYQSLEGFYNSLISQGTLGSAEKIVVAGHSLGGFLAQAFTSEHGNVVSEAYTFNSPGFSIGSGETTNIETQLLKFFGIIDATIPSGKIYNVRALDGLSATAGLGQMIGSVQEVRIEPGSIVHDHRIATLTDAISVQQIFNTFDNAANLSNLATSFISAGAASLRLEGMLDSLRRQLLGTSTISTPIDDRTKLYENLFALKDEQKSDSTIRNLVGKLRFVDSAALAATSFSATAKSDFGDFLALKTLSPFAIRANARVTGSQSALDAVWASVHGADYMSWSADKSARLYGDTTKEFDFTDQWYADRAAMLAWDIKRNMADTDTARGATPESYRYDDIALGKGLTVIGALQAGGNAAAANNPVRISFGSNLADSVAGGDAAIGDHLFGMAGADTIDGNGGNDYVEGNADNDTLSGNDGNDTLLGGEGDDSLHGDNNDDILYGGQGQDTLEGGDGRDQLYGGTEADILRGGIGVDTLDGGSGNDILTGGAGDDILKGGVGGDSYVLAAGDGDDTIDDVDGLGEVRIGADRLIGGDAIGAGLWHQSLNGMDVRYAFTPDVNGRGDLLIQSIAGATTVKNFRSGDLGIVLNAPTQLTIVEPTPAGTMVGTAQDDNRLHQLSTPAISATWGNDRVQGLAGRDEIYGRGGDDIVEGGPGIDVAAGNDGNDAVFADGQLTEAQIRDYISTSATAPTAGAMPTQLLVATSEWLQGGLGADTVVGADGNDILFGGGGRDLLVGGAGHDLINGDDDFEPGDLNTGYVQPAVGTGAPFNAWYSSIVIHDSAWDVGAGDEIHAGSGDDAVYGEIGDDRIWGDDGNDTLAGNEDNDILFGGNGDDQIAGDYYGVVVAGTTASPNGNDFLDGGAGNDRMYGDGGSDTLLGGAGDDLLYGNNPIATGGVSTTAADDGADYLDGGDGNDYLVGDSGADTIFGGSGADYLFGDSDITPAANQNADFLDGGAGSDFLRGYGGDDTLLGGEGDDTIYGEAGNDYIDAGTGNNGVSGGDGDDVILGSDPTSGDFTGNRLQGDAGDDRISGEGFLLGGDGNDTLNTDGVYGIFHKDSLLQGGSGNDTLSAPRGGASMYGDAGDDMLTGGTGISYMSGGDGNDTVVGGAGPNYAWGDAGDDRLDGGGGNDQLSGGNGSDWLAGNSGDDVLIGDDGDDTLAGGSGRNYLAGGAGKDTYVIESVGGEDFIADSEGANVISFGDGVTAAQLAFREAVDQATGACYLVIDGTGGGGQLTILDGLEGAVSSFQFADGTSMSVQQAHDLAYAATSRPSAQVISGKLQMIGSSVDDTVRAPGASLTFSGGFGNDTIIGGAYDDNLQGEAGNDRLVGGGGRNTLTGGDGTDTYVIGLKDGGTTIRDQHLTLPAETDTIEFDAGVLASETQLIRDGSDLVVAMKQGAAQVRISNYYMTSVPSSTGLIAQDAKIEVMKFSDGTVWDSNQIAAHIQSGTTNAISGTPADDVFVIDNALDTVTEPPNGGNDTVRSSVSFSLPSNVERLELTGSLDANAWANAANPVNTLVGNDFNNVFDGPGGPNNSASGGGTGAFAIMYGGKGDDTYYFDYYKGGEAHENPGEGNDTIVLTHAAGDFVLPDNIENVQDVSSGMDRVVTNPDLLTGNDLDNFLGHVGNATGSVSYVIDGGKGADTMQGGQWGDVYYVDNAGDRVVEAFYPATPTARDEVRSTISFQLPDAVEDLTLLGNLNVEGWGNALGNVLDGSQNSASNRLVGGAGDDRYRAGPDDVVVENADEGTDTIEFHGTGTRTYSFADAPANVEGIALGDDLGESAIQGDDGDNYVGGNASANVLSGNGGDDTIEAGDGADAISGGAGDDLLQGQDGSDTYRMGRSFGHDEIRDGTDSNHIVFDDTVNAADAFFEDGELKLRGSGDGIRLASAAGFSNRPDGEKVAVAFVGDVAFSDGTSVSVSELDAALAASFSHASSDHADTLEGTASSDVLTGMGGNDFLWGRAGDDRLSGGSQDDRLFGGDGADSLHGDDGEDQLSGGAGNDLLDGGADSDTLHGDAGDDTLEGGTEADALYGDAGNDTLAGGAGTDKLYGGAGNDSLNGDADTDELYGGDGDDVLVAGDAADLTDIGSLLDGGSGNDMLQGGAGADSLLGGDGNDTLDGGDGDDALYDVAGNNILRGGAGDDRLQAGAGDNVFDGGAGTDVLWGASGGDSYVLKSGGGVDTVIEDWLGGRTTVLVDAGLRPADVMLSRVDEVDGSYFEASANGGADKLRLRYVPEAVPVEIRFADGTVWDQATVFDRLYVRRGTAGKDTLMAGIGNSQLYGYAGNDTLVGGDYNDLLDGGTGADIMNGGNGNDTYVVDDPGDVVVESVAGYDTVTTSISYVLPINLRSLSLTGTASINGTGNTLANTLIGNAANNVLDGKTGVDVLRGGAGDDTYVVDNAADAITENVAEGSDLVLSSVTYTLGANLENLGLTGSGTISGTGNSVDNTLTGNSGANTLSGGLGNDLLDGGAGADTLKGGAGNDTYVVDSSGDVVTELAGEGTDTVKATVTCTLAANIENLTLLGLAAINATGNSQNNILMGNAGNNTLSGAAGADVMSGGAGNDTYVVDAASDVVTENVGEGTDLVQSGVGYMLTPNVENLTLTGTAAINGTGNALNNVLTGNTGNNVLDGGVGADTLIGGAGNDTYVVDVAGDVVTEAASAGTDLVQAGLSWALGANLENLSLLGAAAINGTGNALNNALTGNTADNLLDGGAGADALAGGAGNDAYVVDNAGDTVTEAVNAGFDLVQSGVTTTLAANVEYLTLSGATAINGTGNTLDNWLQGNAALNALDGGIGNDTLWGAAGDDVLLGNAGNDLVQGGLGNDMLTDTVGNNLLDGGAGVDILTGGAARDMLVGGTGADTLTTGGGVDVIAFDKGDGADVVIASVGTDDTLTLGGGLAYGELALRKSGLDLVLDATGGDQITFKNWYQVGVNNKSVLNLQVIADAMAAFNPSGSDPLLNRKVVNFDFTGLVSRFDAALAANPTLTSWNLTNALATCYLTGSDTAAIGGDFAYDYGHRHALSGIGAAPGQTVLQGAGFGGAAQSLQPAGTLYSGSVRLQ